MGLARTHKCPSFASKIRPAGFKNPDQLFPPFFSDRLARLAD